MIDQTISHYRIREELGKGGMGVVYKADDTRLKRTVALKFLDPDAFDTDEDKQRFIREAQVGASLDHPNICAVYEIDERDGHIFMAMAYVEGVTLKKKIQSEPLDFVEAVDVAIRVAKGLSAAHAKGVVHRDIKSSNIMLANDGQVKVTDFGLAMTPEDPDPPEVAAVVGSVAYMSPEQARSKAIDARTDIWSLGVTLYEMVTGKLPFRGEIGAAVFYSVSSSLRFHRAWCEFWARQSRKIRRKGTKPSPK
jgi:serine/threonine protein kinase